MGEEKRQNHSLEREKVKIQKKKVENAPKGGRFSTP